MALSTDEVLDAACALLDADGLEGLSMRRLAGALDVVPAALYHHVADKQSLLAGVADRILAGVEEPLGRWREATQAWAVSLRGELLAHRDGADLVATARGFGLSRRDVTRHPATLLAAAGLPPERARAAAAALMAFILGQVAEQQAQENWSRVHGRVPAMLVEADGVFEVGVALFLDGVAAHLS